MNRYPSVFILVVLTFACVTPLSISQSFEYVPQYENNHSPVIDIEEERLKSPGGALLRSIVLPGWGQYYNNSDSWRRGQLHLAADVSLILGLIYLNTNANRLENNMYSFAELNAGINLRSVGRTVELAAGNYLNLDEYNQAQLISRNWDRLIDDLPQNRWQWGSDDQRVEYVQLRERVESQRQQIPAVITLMVVNRVISGVNAFVQARNMNSQLPEVSFSLEPQFDTTAFSATLTYRF